VKAEQQHSIQRRTDFALTRLDQRQPQGLIGELDAVQVARHAALRSANDDHRRVHVLLFLLHVFETKADRIGQALNIFRPAGQEVPSGCRFRTAVTAEIPLLGQPGPLERLQRIDADADDFEVLAGRPGEFLQAVDHAVQHQRTQHGAIGVIQRQNGRPIALEQRGQRPVPAALVPETQVERNLGAQVFIDPDFGQRFRRGRLPLGDGVTRQA